MIYFKIIGILVGIDIGTGLINAILKKNLSSKRSYIGMFKKVSIIAVVVTAFIIEQILKVDKIGELVSTFFIITEALSILENCNDMGVPIPKFLKDILIEKKGGDGDNTD